MLTRQYHLTLPSSTQAGTIAKLLNTTPLFQSSFPSNPRKASSIPPSRIQFTPSNASDWRAQICVAAERSLQNTKHRRSQGDEGGRGGYGFRSGSGSSGRDDLEERFDKGWVEREGVSGRRVIITGFSFAMPILLLKRAIQERRGGVIVESGLEDGEHAVVRLPG